MLKKFYSKDTEFFNGAGSGVGAPSAIGINPDKVVSVRPCFKNRSEVEEGVNRICGNLSQIVLDDGRSVKVLAPVETVLAILNGEPVDEAKPATAETVAE